jgi:hypothetical protein
MMSSANLLPLAQNDEAMGVIIVIYLAIIVLVIAGMWKVFVKAGQPGWAAIIPIYNTLVMLQVVGKPWWWIFLLMIPYVNIVFVILMMIGLARVFGKGGGFAVGLIFLGFIFIPILGFGSATYIGHRPQTAPPPPPPAMT